MVGKNSAEQAPRTVQLRYPRAFRFVTTMAARKRTIVLAVVSVALLTWSSSNSESLVPVYGSATLAVAVLIYGLIKARYERTPGYYWTGPLALIWFLLVLGANAGQPLLTWLGYALVAGSVMIHYRVESVTAAWGAGLATAALASSLWLVAAEYEKPSIVNLLIIALPLLIMPIIVANVSRPIAIAAIIIMPLISAGWLARIGVTSADRINRTACPTEDAPDRVCIQSSLSDLVRAGWSRLFSDATNNKTFVVQPPPNDLFSVAVLIGYLTYANLALRFNTLRDRSLVAVTPEVETTGEPGSRTADEVKHGHGAAFRKVAAYQQLFQVLTSGRVVLDSPGVVGPPENRNAVQAMAITVSQSPIMAGLAKLLRKDAPVRLRVSLDADACTIVLENGVTGVTEVSRSFSRNRDYGSIALSVQEQAANSVLAYCLAARGSPSWEAWRISGEGLSAAGAARQMRRKRWQNPVDVESAPNDFDVELRCLEEARAAEPRALILGLALGSRYQEVGSYDRAVATYYACLKRYPQFPENYVRVAFASLRLSSSLRSGAIDVIHSACSDTLLSRRLVQWAAEVRGFSRFGAEVLAAQTVLDRSKLLPDQVRNLEKVFLELCQSGALAPMERTWLADFFAFAAVGVVSRGRRRMLRPVLLLHTLFVQSERSFFWPLLFSRFGVRRAVATMRSIELLSILALARAGYWHGAFRTIEEMTARAVDREGTGWRAPALMAEYYRELTRNRDDQELVSPEASGSQNAFDPVVRAFAGVSGLTEPGLEDRLSDFAGYALSRSVDELGFPPWRIDPGFKFLEDLRGLDTSRVSAD